MPDILEGIDISHHQNDAGPIDWGEVALNVDYVFVKATEGLTYRDPWFARNLNGASRYGLKIGAYHFLKRGGGDFQAVEFFDAIRAAADITAAGQLVEELLTFLDVEVHTPTGTHPTIQDIRDFATQWRLMTLRHPLVIYTGYGFWHGTLNNPDGTQYGPLMHARYGPAIGPMYGGWTHPTFWQYTSKGQVPGIVGYVDRQRFYGTYTDLNRLAYRHMIVPMLPKDEHMRILDCPGKPALLIGGDCQVVSSLNQDQRNALRRWGIPAGTVNETERALILGVGE